MRCQAKGPERVLGLKAVVDDKGHGVLRGRSCSKAWKRSYGPPERKRDGHRNGRCHYPTKIDPKSPHCMILYRAEE
jgi:hypothetical protein